MNTWRNARMVGLKQSSTKSRAHRVAVVEDPPSTGAPPPDYADAFEIEKRKSDTRSAERCARDGFERLPLAARQATLFLHRWVLGFPLGPWSSPEHVFGWRIVTSEPELLHLEARSTLLTGHMVWRTAREQLVMSTLLYYQRRSASMVWAMLGNIHRGGAPYLLELATEHRLRPATRRSPR
jgi:hypothetical protein